MRLLSVLFLSLGFCSCLHGPKCDNWEGSLDASYIFNRGWVETGGISGLYISKLEGDSTRGSIFGFACSQDTCFLRGLLPSLYRREYWFNPYELRVGCNMAEYCRTWNITEATEDRFAYRINGHSCTSNYRSTDRVFVDTLNDPPIVFE